MFMFWFCIRVLGMSPGAAFVSAAGLGLSYGFWRYACEAEIYVPACLACLGVMWCGAVRMGSVRRAVTLGVLSGTAVLVHVLLVPCVFAVGVVSCWRASMRLRMFCALSAIFTTALGYGAAIALSTGMQSAVPLHGMVQVVGRAHPMVLVKGLVGLGQSLVSGNFLFSYAGVHERLTVMFPGRNFSEEAFMGKHAGEFVRWVPPCLLVCLVAVGALTLVLAVVRQRSSGRRRTDTGCLISAAVVTVLLYVPAVLVLEPGNPEMWIALHVPLWIIVACAVVRPLAECGRLLPAAGAVLLLGALNLSGGMMLVAEADGDYNARKGRWVIETAEEGDCIVTADSQVFARYLRYHTDACVYDIFGKDPASLRTAWAKRMSSPGRVFVFGDVLSPPSYLAQRHERRYKELSAFGREIAADVVPVHTNGFGGVYRVRETGGGM